MRKFDVVSAGPGLASLVCAALVSRRGFRVLHVPREEESYSLGIGPQNHSFPVSTYYYDIRSGIMGRILKEIGIASQIEYTATGVLSEIHIGDFVLECPAGWLEYRDRLSNMFPGQRESFGEYFKTISDLAREWEIIIMSDEFPKFSQIPGMVRYQRVKYADYLDKLFGSTLIKDILSVDMVYSQISLVTMAGYIFQMFNSGYITGGYKRLRDLLCGAIAANGGEIFPGARLGDFSRSEDGKYFIGTVAGEQIRCRDLVFNYDENTFEQVKYMVVEPAVRLDGRCSSVLVNLKCRSTGEGRRYPGIIKYFPNGDIQAWLENLECGFLPDRYAFILHFPLEKAAPGEEDAIQIEIPVSLRWTEEALDKAVDKVMDTIGTVFPNIFGQNIYRQVIYPKDLEKALGLAGGIQSHWAFSPDEMKKNPLNMKTPLPGLYLAGNWGKAFFTGGKVIAKAISKSRTANPEDASK